ncbi:HAD family hydrolase [Kribbella albertanoniae]|uniref:HAD family hydrolase n=1 Tax=Kribbella albertanoniae TaxID=1266829 RepID=A0A4V2XQB6_9ACTN|nr:HAD-IA family hydrolase [Kribbella albertanoniae]TDC25315.1 HAD family hydrolase [Kribbella albertanoniae]
MTAETLAAILHRSPVILLDFDGPVCSVFAGYPAAQIADDLRALAYDQLGLLPAALGGLSSPHDVLLECAGVSRDLAASMDEALRNAEVKAVQSATPTPGIDQFLAACQETGHKLAIVTNNAAAAVHAYLARSGLTGFVHHIEARNPADPTLMKPNPYLIQQAAQALGAAPETCTLIGDQPTDIRAAQASGAATIAYANKPGKANALTTAGADAIIDRISDLTEAIRSR